MENQPRKPCPTDATEEAWAFVAPSPTLVDGGTLQRGDDRREVFDARRRIVRAGAPWRTPPTNGPLWAAVHPQTRRRIAAGVRAMMPDRRAILRWADGGADAPTAVILDGRAVRSTPESGARGADDGHDRRQGNETHAPIDTPGHLLARHRTPPNAREREPVGGPASAAHGRPATG